MSILDLPAEILDSVLSHTSRQTLKSICLTCQRLYPHASALIWHTIEIKDKCSPRRDTRDGYRIEGAPELDADSDLYPGMPLRWGGAALQPRNPRGPRNQVLPVPNVVDPNQNIANLNRNPLDPSEIAEQERRDRNIRYSQLDGCANALGMDQHDDTPTIKKLYLLASRPDLAAHVRVVWAKCHLPMPDMSTELVWMCSGGQTLSSDWTTLLLLRLAIRNMVNVTTLRFAMPHWNVYWIMMCDFMDGSRKRNLSVSRLWLETCTAVWDAGLWPSRCDFSTIKSIRFRRLKVQEDIRPAQLGGVEEFPAYFLARTGPPVRVRNGLGGLYFTSTHELQQESQCRPQIEYNLSKIPPDELFEINCRGAKSFENTTNSNVPDVKAFLASRLHGISDLPTLVEPSSLTGDGSREFHKGRRMVRWIRQHLSSLVHLNIDWLILRKPQRSHDFTLSVMERSTQDKFMFADLSKLRIATLRTFQLRNALSLNSLLPPEVFLLTPTTFTNSATGDDVHKIDFLGFLEGHPNLNCLAWPMDAFLRDELWDGSRPKSPEQLDLAKHAQRVEAVIDRLGRMLETLRLDIMFRHQGEPQTEVQGSGIYEFNSCARRRLCITAVASRMRSVKTLKIEGYIPRDEKREILRAMAWCPLERFISIGRTFPLGNTWGEAARDLERIEGLAWGNTFLDNFEVEELPALESMVRLPIAGNMRARNTPNSSVNPYYDDLPFTGLQELGYVLQTENGASATPFRPRWTWLPTEPPLLHSIAYFFADTITELKFCGFNGSIIYGRSSMNHSDVNDIVLHSLQHFHNLKNLIISYYLVRDTRFEEDDVILTWLCERDALWHGKDESFEDEQPNEETDEIPWDDIATNEVGQCDLHALSQVLESHKKSKLVQHALRRAFIWDKTWSIQSSIKPFPEFPDFELFQEGQRQNIDFLVKYGMSLLEANDSLPRNSLGPYTRDPNDRSETITMRSIIPFPPGQPVPPPGTVFAPFTESHYFSKWFHSPFLNEPSDPQEIEFFWKHVASSLQVLRYRFSPGRMAEQICREMSGYLSPRALGTSEGVKVRASFCMGTESNDVFDLDVLMNSHGVKRFWGPRPEVDSGRWRQKNDVRQYF
jgi:hypothetical protein